MLLIITRCGHGSTTLDLALRFPKSRVTAFSLSKAHLKTIEKQITERGINNVILVQGDIGSHDFPVDSFDRVVVIEALEFCTNFEILFKRVSDWLKPQGKMFAQTIVTPSITFEAPELSAIVNDSRFLSAYHFIYFQRDLTLLNRWWFNGSHVTKTVEVIRSSTVLQTRA